jgi:hypothetical protein
MVLVPTGETVSRLVVILDPGGVKLAGVVLDATGGVVSGAVLRAVVDLPSYRAVSGRSGPDGRFAFWVAPGALTILADATGYAPARVYRVAPAGDVVFRLVPAAVVRGAVVAVEDGHPLADVEVRAMAVGKMFAPVEPVTRTDADGNFALANLEPGGYTFVAEGPGRRGTSGPPILIGLAEQRENLRIVASAVAQVRGRVVVDPDGTPCREGMVRMGPSIAGRTNSFDAPDAAPSTRTSKVPQLVAGIEADGTVRFPSAPPGTYRVGVDCTGYLFRDGPLEVDVNASDVADLVWKVAAGSRLTIRFVDELDRPVPAARGRLVLQRAGRTVVTPVLADVTGRYEHPTALHPGAYTIQPDTGYEGDPVNVELSDQPVEAVVRLRGKASIFVSVRTPQGGAIDDVEVYAIAVEDPAAKVQPSASAPAGPFGPEQPTSRVDSIPLGGGRFRLGPLHAGRFEVHATDGTNPPFSAGSAPSGREQAEVVELRSGRDVELTVTADRGASISGKVVDGSGQPVPDVWVRARCEGNAGSPRSFNPDSPARRFVSGPDGRFAIDGLSPNAVCSVEAERPLGPIGVVADARPGQDIVVALPDPGTLAGTAEGPDGERVEAFDLLVQDATGRPLPSQSINAPGGRWKVGGVSPGTLHLQARSAPGNIANADVELASGASLDSVRLVFGPGPQASGMRQAN